jgi:hypothetical protein
MRPCLEYLVVMINFMLCNHLEYIDFLHQIHNLFKNWLFEKLVELFISVFLSMLNMF